MSCVKTFFIAAMLAMLNVLYILLLVPVFIKATSHSPSTPPSPTDFDWKTFLVDSPEHAITSTVEANNNSHQLENALTSPILPNESSVSTINPALPSTIRKSHISEAEKEEIARMKTNKRSKKYRNKIKQSTGFTSKLHARLHNFRLLEKNGQITEQQKDELNNYRKSMRDYMKRYKLQKYQLTDDPLATKPKRGRPQPPSMKRPKGRPKKNEKC